MAPNQSQQGAAHEAALLPFAAPLRFAARDNFAHLARIMGLRASLCAALKQAMALLPQHAATLQRLMAHIPDDALPLATRAQALRQLWQAYHQLLPELGRGVTPPTPDPPMPAQESAPTPPPEAAGAHAPAGTPPQAGLALSAAVRLMHGVGPRVAECLAQRGIITIADLLGFVPRRYQGQSGYAQLGELRAGVVATVEATVQQSAMRQGRGRRSLEVIVVDETGSLHLVWFRVPGGRAFAESFRHGVRVRATGTIKAFRHRLQMSHPQVQVLPQVAPAPAPAVATGPADAIVPLYLEVEGLHPQALRRLLARALPFAPQLVDPLPHALRRRRNLCSLAEAIIHLHAPPADTALEALHNMATPWQQRLIYDELLLLQLSVLRTRAHHADAGGRALQLDKPLCALATELLPFAPTGAQLRVLGEIDADLRRGVAMQRLLQGDVGSGKTAVALTAAVAVARSGLQVALMAPTELLAEQHARTALKWLAPRGISVALLTGQTPAAERRACLQNLRAGNLSLVIGTHALIQQKVAFKALALGIVDEQHRFGVMQRARLQELGRQSLGTTPHVLVMTATPIPRTLALTVYGDLDTSVLDELPPGRTPIITRLFRDGARAQVYREVRAAVAQGRQAYVVFPLVESSDKEGMTELRDATSAAEELAAGPLQGLRLALLHGRMRSDEKDAVMRGFAHHEVDVLVATTVIEVGIDVPNASVMVIEHAERFGLSQLHQLRGRVGRGSAQSSCLLLMRRPGEEAFRRLAVMEQTADGFKIAEEDLAIRGPGDFVGTRQAGLPELSLADLGRDAKLLYAAREDATAMLAHDPQLMAPVHQELARRLALGDSRHLALIRVG